MQGVYKKDTIFWVQLFKSNLPQSPKAGGTSMLKSKRFDEKLFKSIHFFHFYPVASRNYQLT
jgi:hypothetical protein